MPGLPGRSAFGGFVRETGGNVLILFALCLPLVILAVGAAVDFGRGADAQVKIQSALDAAALAGAKAISQGETDKDEVEKIAKATFDANLADNIRVFDETPTLTVDIDSDAGTLKVSSKSKVDHVFSVLGTDKSSVVGATSTAAFNSLNIELAMMLDVTGSMGG
ncbi:MAG: pilus assembly protein, partial [Rhodobiaceae bacterium]|nr:pilus assembly protein [Rhodobiaceae bacterium]